MITEDARAQARKKPNKMKWKENDDRGDRKRKQCQNHTLDITITSTSQFEVWARQKGFKKTKRQNEENENIFETERECEIKMTSKKNYYYYDDEHDGRQTKASESHIFSSSLLVRYAFMGLASVSMRANG